VIGVVIKHDLVPIPQPVIDERIIELAHAEVGAIKPESRRASTKQPKAVLGAEAEREAAVRPRVFYVKARVLTPVIMADPVPIRVNVRSLWMPRPVGPSVALWSSMRLSS